MNPDSAPVYVSRRALREAAKPAPAPRKPRASLRSRLSAAGVMVVILGLVVPFSLPAFAQVGADAAADAGAAFVASGAQSLEVSSEVADPSVTREKYKVTDPGVLQRAYRQAIRDRNIADYLASGAKALGDDYPWFADLSRNQGGGLSPLRYYYRECVDFVAWRLNRDAGVTSAPWKWDWASLGAGSAYSWRSAWENHGWATGKTPEPGAVAYFPGQNHVAYVSGILSDGTVLIEEYNWSGMHVYGQRIIDAGDAYYLYAPG